MWRLRGRDERDAARKSARQAPLAKVLAHRNAKLLGFRFKATQVLYPFVILDFDCSPKESFSDTPRIFLGHIHRSSKMGTYDQPLFVTAFLRPCFAGGRTSVMTKMELVELDVLMNAVISTANIPCWLARPEVSCLNRSDF